MKNMISGKKKSSTFDNFVKHLIDKCSFKPENKQYILFRLLLLLFAFLLISLNWYVADRKDNYSIGSPSMRTYFALTTSRYEDKAATLELRQRAANRIVDVMVRDEEVASEVTKKLNSLQKGDYSAVLTPALTDLLKKLPPESTDKIILTAVSIGKKIPDKAQTRDQQTKLIWQHLRLSEIKQAEKNVVFQLLNAVLNPSLQSDSEMAARLRDDISLQIPAVVREIRPGSVLVQKGQIITQQSAKLLKSQGYPDAEFPWKNLVFVLFVILAWSFWPVWIENGLKEKLSVKEWIYVAIILSLSWSLELFFARIGGYSMAVLGMTGWLCLTIPISLSYHIIFGGGIISVLIAYGVSPGVVTIGFILASFSAGIGRVLFIDPPNHRMTIWKNLFFLGLCLGIVNIFIHWGLGLAITRNLIISCLIFSAVWGAIVVALLPLWENIFDIISPLRLLELSHPSQPLMKRLQIEAPGTYHHTLMVGTLAEAAADELKMNGLLVKAGAYYHDIGKLKNPNYFVENQMQGENIHDTISPSLSELILISHVKDGLEIAEENRLPKVLWRFISEHHGTTLQKYFYEKAQAMSENVTEEQFRYPGPKPQTRETALVMLADSVEAAVKSTNKPFETIRELNMLVDSVIETKVRDNQLDNIDFTLRDMTIIKSSFVEVLRSRYHSREVRNIKDVLKDRQSDIEAEKRDSK